MLDRIGWVIFSYGPWRLVCNADTAFGRWCLRRAGSFAYRDHDFGDAAKRSVP